MLFIKSIQKRKAKKAYVYIFQGIIVFFVVLTLCLVEFVFIHPSPGVISPLASWKKILFQDTSTQGRALGQIQDACNRYSLNCQNIFLSQDSIEMTIDGKKILLSAHKNIEEETASLQLTLKALTMEGKEFHGLDFRYDRPVISY